MGVFGPFCLMYAFSYENVLFYVSSGFTAYSHVLLKIIKMAAQNLSSYNYLLLKKSDIRLIKPKFRISVFDILIYEVGIPPKPLITVGRIDISPKTSVWALILTFLSKIWEYAVKAKFTFR